MRAPTTSLKVEAHSNYTLVVQCISGEQFYYAFAFRMLLIIFSKSILPHHKNLVNFTVRLDFVYKLK